jgi:hypothetical protein
VFVTEELAGDDGHGAAQGARFIAARDISAFFATVDRVCTSGAVKLRHCPPAQNNPSV